MKFFIVTILGVFIGTFVIAKLDERYVDQGEELHRLVKVAVVPGDGGRPFNVSALNIALNTLPKELGNSSYLMPKLNDSMDFERSHFTYNVIENKNSEQLIELEESYNDGDNTIWTRYRVKDNIIEPVSSRMFYFGYMFDAIPYALGFAFIISVIGG